MRFWLLLALFSLVPSPASSDEPKPSPKITFPLPCTCSNYRPSYIADSTHFELALPEQGYPGGYGTCSLQAYAFEEQYCPLEPGCMALPRVKAVATLASIAGVPRSDCNRYYFAPYVLPFHNGPYEIGPFSRGQSVTILLAWFTQNIFLARTISGPLSADVEREALKLSGVIPLATTSDIMAEVEVENRNAKARLQYIIRVKP